MSIETILAQHTTMLGTDGPVCACMERFPDRSAHRAHLADLIRAALTGDEAVEAVARAISQVTAPDWWDGDRPATFEDFDGLDKEYAVPGDDDVDAARAALSAAVETLGAGNGE